MQSLCSTAVQKELPAGLGIGNPIICLKTIDSTNTYLKQLAGAGATHGTVVLAHEQTGGRGRKERRFESHAGAGLYCSVLLRLSCMPDEAVDLTAWTAVAVCDTVEQCCKVRPGIKWSNDLILNHRKLGGILTEMEVNEAGTLDYVVIGIGINLTQTQSQFAEVGLEDIATSLELEGAWSGVAQERLVAALIVSLDSMVKSFPAQKEQWLLRYREDCVTIGKRVLVTRGEQSLPALALWVEDDFSLRVRYDNGLEECVTSGEVSICT